MSTSSGTINSVNINAITLFCAGFTKTQIENAEKPKDLRYSYDTSLRDGLDINQSDWRDYTSAFAEDFNNAEFTAASPPLRVLFSSFFSPQGELLVTNQHPWGAEKISNTDGFGAFLGQFAIDPTYREFVDARQTRAPATPNPQARGKSHKKRRKSRKKRRKSRSKKRRKSRKKRRKSRSKKRRTNKK